jgi:hypothetical protein
LSKKNKSLGELAREAETDLVKEIAEDIDEKIMKTVKEPEAPKPKKEPTPPAPPEWEGKRWHGHPVYECPECPYDTIDGEHELNTHIARKHRAPEAIQEQLIIRTDRYGNELKE